MNEVQLLYQRIEKRFPPIEFHSPGAIAFDLYSREPHKFYQPGEYFLAPANIRVKIPEGYGLIISSRSSSRKKGYRIIPGWIDTDFNGPHDEVMIQVEAAAPFELRAGTRIAQARLVEKPRVKLIERPWDSTESRGGFGSTD